MMEDFLVLESYDAFICLSHAILAFLPSYGGCSGNGNVEQWLTMSGKAGNCDYGTVTFQRYLIKLQVIATSDS